MRPGSACFALLLGRAAATAPLSAGKRAEFSERLLLLDHDGDGTVRLGEAAAGLRAIGQPLGRSPIPRRLELDRALCAPSAEPGAFLDCVSARARRAVAAHGPAAPVDFEAELRSFIGGLDDDPPPGHGLSRCDELVDAHQLRCSELERSGHCRLSCGAHERAFFSRLPTVMPSRRRAQQRVPRGDSPRGGSAKVLLSSDWHLEPWYDTTGAGSVDGDVRISRFNSSDATMATFGTCRQGTGRRATVVETCPTTSLHDPPIAFGRSHFEAFAARTPDIAERGVLFFLGDGQPHEFHRPFFVPPNAEVVAEHARRLISMSLEFFPASRIFWTAGNNDGPHNRLFVHRGGYTLEEEEAQHAISDAWAAPLIAAGVVSNVLPRRYDFELVADPSCSDDVDFVLLAANSSCADAAANIAAMRTGTGAMDACGCVPGEGWSGSLNGGAGGCAPGKTTNPDETLACSCSRQIDDPEDRSGIPGAAAAGWAEPRRCLAPGEDGEGCVAVRELCPRFCQECWVPNAEVHERQIGPVAFFRRTGYYIKQLDRDDRQGLADAKLFAIVLNTNLGAANAPQTAALISDLAWISAMGGRAYLLGHHPHVMKNPELVPEHLRPVVLGSFAGHVHWASSTDELGFTQVSSVSQAGETSFSTMTIGLQQGLEPAIALDRDVVSWLGANGDANDQALWQVLQGDANDTVRQPKDAGRSLAWLAAGAVLALAVGSGGAVAAWRKRAGAVARTTSRESIYQGGGLDGVGKESNPVLGAQAATSEHA